MPEGNKPFVITDRRRFTVEGEVRPDAPLPTDRSAGRSVEPEPAPSFSQTPDRETGPRAVPPAAVELESRPEPDASSQQAATFDDFPAPTEEQTEQSRRAYQQTADRIDTAIRATNPGMDHPPAVNFEQLVQSLYMTAIVQLGGGPGEGQQPQIDLLGARSSIDMLGVLNEKTRGNLSAAEARFLESALFEVRMAFLEITQALARSANTKAAEGSPFGPGPSIGSGPVGVKR